MNSFLNFRFDGTEYRFFTEIVKEYTLEIVLHSYTSNAWDLNTVKDLNSTRCDLVLCSLWITQRRYNKFDISMYYDFQCGTFLVPKPSIINAALYVYLPLTNYVWFGIFISFVLTGICVTALSRVGQRQRMIPRKNQKTVYWNSVYNQITRSYLEMFSSTTGHGIHVMPNKTRIKLLLMG